MTPLHIAEILILIGVYGGIGALVLRVRVRVANIISEQAPSIRNSSISTALLNSVRSWIFAILALGLISLILIETGPILIRSDTLQHSTGYGTILIFLVSIAVVAKDIVQFFYLRSERKTLGAEYWTFLRIAALRIEIIARIERIIRRSVELPQEERQRIDNIDWVSLRIGSNPWEWAKLLRQIDVLLPNDPNYARIVHKFFADSEQVEIARQQFNSKAQFYNGVRKVTVLARLFGLKEAPLIDSQYRGSENALGKGGLG